MISNIAHCWRQFCKKRQDIFILSYKISLLVQVPLLKVGVERIKYIFTINVGKEEYVVFLCSEREDSNISGAYI